MEEDSIIYTEQNAILQSIKQVSKHKRYQASLMVFLTINILIFNLSTFSTPILFENPTFKCQGSAQTFTEDQACPIINECIVNHEYTVTSKLQLYCTQQKINQRNIIQSISGFGGFFGVLMINWLADRKGKKFCVILAIALMLVYSMLLLVGILLENVELIIISYFIQGYSTISYLVIVCLLSVKFLAGQLSQYVVVLINLFGNGLCQILAAIVNNYFPNWEVSVILYLIFFPISLASSTFFVKQDPIFFFNNNEVDKLMNLVQQVGVFNKTEQTQIIQAQNSLINRYRFKRSPQICSIIPSDIISFKLILFLLIMGFCSFATNIVYFGLSYGLQSLKLTMTETLLICGVAQTSNYILTALIMPYLPSIPTILYFSATISSISSLSLSLDIVNHSFLFKVIMLFMARFFLITFGCFYVTYYIGNLPKNIEGTSAGIIQSHGCIARICVPLLLTLSKNIHIDQILISSVVLMISIFPLMLLSRTKQNEEIQYESTSLDKQ